MIASSATRKFYILPGQKVGWLPWRAAERAVGSTMLSAGACRQKLNHVHREKKDKVECDSCVITGTSSC